jgi:hypothetical protein
MFRTILASATVALTVGAAGAQGLVGDPAVPSAAGLPPGAPLGSDSSDDKAVAGEGKGIGHFTGDLRVERRAAIFPTDPLISDETMVIRRAPAAIPDSVETGEDPNSPSEVGLTPGAPTGGGSEATKQVAGPGARELLFR